MTRARFTRAGWQPVPFPAGAPAFPGPFNTGANLTGVTLTQVPADATSGTGWLWDATPQYIQITSADAVVSGLAVAGGCLVKAAGVTVENCTFSATANTNGYAGITFQNCVVQTPGAEGINFEAGATYGSVIDCTISGLDDTTNRLGSCVTFAASDPYAYMSGCNCTMFRQGVNLAPSGYNVVVNNYFSTQAWLTGDHTEPICGNFQCAGVISGNTALNSIDQTACIILDGGSNVPILITGNLLGGAGYSFYAGDPVNYAQSGTMPTGPTSGITFENNYFSTLYYPNSGYDGWTTNWQHANTGNVWGSNYWYDGVNKGSLIAMPADTYTYNTPPAMPASGGSAANTLGLDVVVVIYGSGVTTTPAAVNIDATTNQVQLQPGSSVTISYSGATPTWQWITGD